MYINCICSDLWNSAYCELSSFGLKLVFLLLETLCLMLGKFRFRYSKILPKVQAKFYFRCSEILLTCKQNFAFAVGNFAYLQPKFRSRCSEILLTCKGNFPLSNFFKMYILLIPYKL